MTLGDHTTIFVHFPTRRDRAARRTLDDLFATARHPERVTVGICRWPAAQDDGMNTEAAFRYEPRPLQVRSINNAPGTGPWPTAGRHLAQSLRRDADYILQINANTRFVPDWDSHILAQWAACDAPNTILTVSPPAHAENSFDAGRTVFVQAPRAISRQGVATFQALPVDIGPLTPRPLPTAGCDMSFIFGPASMADDVPLDPALDGRVAACGHAVRLWTHGYDLFSPSERLVFRARHRATRKRPGGTGAGRRPNMLGLERLNQLLASDHGMSGEAVDLGRYGLGTARSLAQYQRYAGVDFKRRTIASHAQVFPFVHDHSVFADLIRDARQFELPNAHLFLLDGGGILFRESDSSLHVLNDGATLMWCALEEGQPLQAVRDQLHGQSGDPPEIVDRDILASLVEWTGQSPGPHAEERRAAGRRPAKAPLVPAGHKIKSVVECAYSLLDTKIRVRYASREQAAAVNPVLAHLACPAGTDGPVIEIDEVGNDHRILVEGREVFRTLDPLALAPEVKFQVMTLALGDHDHMLNVHAGVVAHGEHCLLLPGARGSGKTTLVAGLVAAGFDYLSDEVAPLDRTDCSVRPVPLSLCVKDSAVDVLAPLFPEVGDLAVHRRQDNVSVRYLPVPTRAAPGRRYPIGWVVFPRYRRGGSDRLRPLDRVLGIKRLVEETVAVPRSLCLDDVARLTRSLERVAYFELDTGTLDGAVAAVRRVVNGEAARTATG